MENKISEELNYRGNMNMIERNLNDNTNCFFRKNYKLLSDIALKFYEKDRNNEIEKNLCGPQIYLDDETIILMVADFFQTIDPMYQEKFWDAYYNNKINYKKDIKYSNFNYNQFKNEYCVNVHKGNRLSDAFSLVHEMTHLLSSVKWNEDVNLDVLIFTEQGRNYEEFPSVLIEFLFCDYLKKLGVPEYDIELAKDTRKNEFDFNLQDIVRNAKLYEIMEETGSLTKEKIDSLIGTKCFENKDDIEKVLQENSQQQPISYKYFIATALACSVYDRGVSKQEVSEFIEDLHDISCKDYLDREGMDLNNLDSVVSSLYKRFCTSNEPKVKSLKK